MLSLLVLLLAGFVAYQRFEPGSSPPPRPGGAMVFQIGSKPSSLLHPSAPADPAEVESFRQSQTALVRSRRTLNTALNSPGIRDSDLIRTARPNALSWLEENLRVTLHPSSRFMMVELDGENDKEVLELLNAVGKAYLAAAEERTNGSRIHRQDDLEHLIAECRNELKRNNERLEEMTRLLGVTLKPATLTFDQFTAKDYEKVTDELRRVRLDRAVYLANRPAARPAGAESGAIAVAGGASALPQRPAPAADGLDTPEGRGFAAREQFWIKELAVVRSRIDKTSTYAADLNNLRRTIRAREADLDRYETALWELKDELWAPPRVVMTEEPYFRPVK